MEMPVGCYVQPKGLPIEVQNVATPSGFSKPWLQGTTHGQQAEVLHGSP